MAGNYKLAMDYIDVASRIVEFRTKHPEGSLQQHGLEFREFGGQAWVVYTAAAYRTPDDARPGVGTAWEPVPGKTSFTRDSELQNAETAAWGRAIVAALAADTRKGIASAEEVRNRQPDDPPREQARRTQAPSEPAPDFAALIDKAKTSAELAKVGQQMATATINPAEQETLRALYRVRAQELKAEAEQPAVTA